MALGGSSKLILPRPARRLSVFVSFKKESSYGHVDVFNNLVTSVVYAIAENMINLDIP